MILDANFLPQFPDRFSDLLAVGSQLERVVKVKKRILCFTRALVSFCARHKTLHARWVHTERVRGCARSLMVLTSPSLTSAKVEQKMQLELRKLRAYVFVLMVGKALKRVAISVRGLAKLTLSEEHVAILEEFVQQNQSAKRLELIDCKLRKNGMSHVHQERQG